MDIVRNADGTLVVPVRPERRHDAEDGTDTPAGDEAVPADVEPATRVLHPGEGGYDEALAEWDLQQNPDRAPVVSTATGDQRPRGATGCRQVTPADVGTDQGHRTGDGAAVEAGATLDDVLTRGPAPAVAERGGDVDRVPQHPGR